jgi:hypothetical protein
MSEGDGPLIAQNARQIGSLRDRRKPPEMEAIELGNRCSIQKSSRSHIGALRRDIPTSALGQKQTLQHVDAMSALPPENGHWSARP